MTAKDERLTKLSQYDRSVISLLGLTIILGLGALLDAPFLKVAIAGTVFVAALQIYGRLPRPRDLPDPALKAAQRDAGIFDQRIIADSLSEAVWIVNSREQVVYTNHAGSALFGRTPYGRRLATILREPDVLQLVKKTIAGETGEAVDYHSSDPVDRYLRVTATPISVEREDDSPRRFAMLVFYDVTDLVKFAMTQGDFLANASHELKTPVASLLGYIETLRGHARNDAKARERFLEIMQDQAERMQRLISDLLSLRRIEQSEHIAPSEIADIRQAADFACNTVLPLARARGVSVSVEGERALKVKGHQDELVQLCLNITDNAVKMSPKGSQVSLRISRIAQWRPQDFIPAERQPGVTTRQIIAPAPAPQGYGVITFTDSGPGFAPKHIPRLGERFYRISGDRNSAEKGTGLGLAIVKHLVKQHRGGLIVSSRHDGGDNHGDNHNAEATDKAVDLAPQTGTVFTLFLPLQET